MPSASSAAAVQVHACEWNPPSAAALRHNLKANGVGSRCVVYEDDCRLVAPNTVADRVILGLLPSSQSGWATAVECLRPEGAGKEIQLEMS